MEIQRCISWVLLVAGLSAAFSDAAAQDPANDAEAEPAPEAEASDPGKQPAGPRLAPVAAPVPVFEIEGATIIGDFEQRQRIAGSAHVIDDELLEAFEYDDVGRALLQVPGVYVRGEDGFGLRPNIGIRGATPERSKKITLMEDGVLLGPAPYSAPAAYYFPLVTRVTGIEVFKGPAAIQHGPNTVGGAINLLTREVPNGFVMETDNSYGLNNSLKSHTFVGFGDTNFGLLADLAYLGTDGFKHLPNGANTGFNKGEGMLKARLNTDPSGNVYHGLQLKLGWSQEDSRETYLGLTDADFAADPYQRYAASGLGHMQWQRSQAVLTYDLRVGDWLEARIDAYRHDFSRSWTKLNALSDRRFELGDVLGQPLGQNATWVDVLRGERDSDLSSVNRQQLYIGENARTFQSQGVQLNAQIEVPELEGLEQSLRFGMRLHNDVIRRVHTEALFDMADGELVRATQDVVARENRDVTTAFSLHLSDEVIFGDFMLVPGMRLEIIDNSHAQPSAATAVLGSDVAFMPGLGASYKVMDELTVLAGIYQGYGAPAPGRSGDIQPERSLNTEFGGRFKWKTTRAELIGFFNAYQNLVDTCTASAGCRADDIDGEVAGGGFHIGGLEALAGHRWDGPYSLWVEGQVNYTLTWSAALNDVAGGELLGTIRVGDQLPYVPVHQVSAVVGMGWQDLRLDFSFSYVGEMRDVAGQGSIETMERIPDRALLDISLSYTLQEQHRFYVNIYNATNSVYAVSRRPFGLRPGRPIHMQVGYQFSFKGLDT